MRAVATLWLLAACGGSGKPVENLQISECLNPDGEGEPPTEELLLTSGEQALTIAHRAHTLNCAHELEVFADADEETRTVTVTYDDVTRTPADCTCLYDLAYRVSPLADGTWTVVVPGGLRAEGLVD